jgi:hypothetical protein
MIRDTSHPFRTSAKLSQDAWDSYIQGPGMDQGTQASTWMPMDFSGLPNPGMQSSMGGGMQTHHTGQPLPSVQPQGQGPQGHGPQGQGIGNAFSGNAGVFMGVSTPPGGSVMMSYVHCADLTPGCF